MNSRAKYEWNRYSVPVMAILISVVIPLLQYHFRRFDNNTFTGWDMVFTTTSPVKFFLILVSGILLTMLAFRISYPYPFPRLLFLFFACSIVTIFFLDAAEVNVSASRYVTQAKHLELYGIPHFFREWGNEIQAWMDMPAVPFFDGLIFRIFGESRIYIQLFTAFLFGMTSVITYLIGKEVWDEDTGFYAGLLLLGIPYLIIQTPLMLLDVHTMFFLTLSIYLYIRALATGGSVRMLVATCAVFIASFCKYSVWPMLSVLPVISLVYYFQTDDGSLRGKVLQRSVRVLLLSLLLVGVAVALKFEVVVGQIKLLLEFQRPSLGRWTENFTSIFLFQINPVISIAAIFSLFYAVRKRDLKYMIVVWLPLLAAFFQLKRVRYILPFIPMLTLMAAQGLAALKNPQLRKVIVASVIMTSFVTCFFLFQPFLNQWSAVNLKDAGQFLDTLDIDAVEVFALPQQNYPVNPAVAVPLLDLFTHKRIFYHYIPGASSPDEDFHISRFRDSWEYRNPLYYTSGAEHTAGKRAVAVILANLQNKIPPEVTEKISTLHHSRSFTTAIPFFFNQTLVQIYWQ
jgi:4-amino-4-deoxy-L-arabinose transferase-like glycosyltransferase